MVYDLCCKLLITRNTGRIGRLVLKTFFLFFFLQNKVVIFADYVLEILGMCVPVDGMTY